MKRIFLLSITVLSLLPSCDEPENPGYPAKPSIKFEKIKFIEVGDAADLDSLRLTFSYKDGDSDLGLSWVDQNDFLPPYNDIFYFQEDGAGDTSKFIAEGIQIDDHPYYFTLLMPVHDAGLLVTRKTREKDSYDYLPEYNPSNCNNYRVPYFAIVPKAALAVDESFSIQDTLTLEGQEFILLDQEVLFYQPNENYYNIFVEFYQSIDGEVFTKYDWFGNECYDFNGRIPLILDNPAGIFTAGTFKIKIHSPWEGQIMYSMISTSFLAVFGNNFLKLRVTIQDRALHKSNTIETPVFKLADIK